MFVVSSSKYKYPCKLRASAQRRYKLWLYGCLVLFSNVREILIQFSVAVLVKQHLYNTQVRLRVKQQLHLDLPTCKTSIFRSADLYCTNRWRQFCCKNPLASTNSSLVNTNCGFSRLGSAFECSSVSEPSIFNSLQKETKGVIHFCCILLIKKLSYFSSTIVTMMFSSA